MSVTEKKIFLLLQNQKTKEKGFKLLMDTFQKQVYWQIRELTKNHEDTNDILQNVFVKVWRFIDNFKGESKLSSWLYSIAKNETFTFLNKKNKRKIANLDDETKIHIFNSLEADIQVDSETIYAKLLKACDTLPKKQKQVFNLRYFKEMKYREMAKILSLSEGGLKATYHHAVKKIEKILKEN